MDWDNLWKNAHIVTMQGDDYGIIHHGAIAEKKGKIVWIGKQSEIPHTSTYKAEHDCQQMWITPGLIDCHTHLLYGGNRSAEFEERLTGRSYLEIASKGGGILSTVRATRSASADKLYEEGLLRIERLMEEGVTAVEIKSGYGLSLESEEKMLQVIHKMSQNLPAHIFPTFLGAHTVPSEFSGRADEYMTHICTDMLPQLVKKGLIHAVDAYCETVAFSSAQVDRLFQEAHRLHVPVKLHADQFSNQSGASLVAKYRGLSADHLEYVSTAGVKSMAEAGTVAVLLPGAFYFLRESQIPPIATFREMKVPMAIATDCNPGTSPIFSMLTVMNMACVLFSLTPYEVLAGVTKYAAKALGVENQMGSLAVGKQADFVIWKIDQPVDLMYNLGRNPCHQIIMGGQPGQAKATVR